MKTKHCVGNTPHLHMFLSCPNPPTHPCFRHNPSLVIPRHDLWALAHFQPHLTFHCHKFPYPKHHLSDLSLRIQRSCLLYLFLANVRIPKHSFIHVSSTSTVVLLNSARSKTRSHGSCPTCKPVQPKHGENMSWLRYLRRHYAMVQHG